MIYCNQPPTLKHLQFYHLLSYQHVTKWANAIKWVYNQQLHQHVLWSTQTLGHVIGGCETALLDTRYNWWHDSILLSIYKTIKSQGLQVFVHRDGYTNPSIITGDEQREDFAMQKVIVIVIRTHCRFWNKHSGNFWL